MNTPDQFSIESHFENKDPIVQRIYDKLLRTVGSFGPVSKEAKKTSIHLLNVTAFAGVATRKNSLNLTIKGNHKLSSARIHKTQQVSAKRFHHEVKLTSPADVDRELLSWLKEAYLLSA